jgi:hypothetical protein
LWLVKKDTRKPVEYGLILAALLSYRIVMWFYPRVKKRNSYATVHPAPATK